MKVEKYAKSINAEGNISIYVRDKEVTVEIKEFNHLNYSLIHVNKCFNVTLNNHVSEAECRNIIKDFLKEEFCLEDIEMDLLSESTKIIHSVPLLSRDDESTYHVDSDIEEVDFEYLIRNVSFQNYYYSILLNDLKVKDTQFFNMSIDFDHSREEHIILKYKDMSITLSNNQKVNEEWSYWKINNIFLKRKRNDKDELYLKLHEVYENLGLYARGISDGNNLVFDVNGTSFIIRPDDLHIPHVNGTKVILLNEEVSKVLSNLSKIFSMTEGDF